MPTELTLLFNPIHIWMYSIRSFHSFPCFSYSSYSFDLSYFVKDSIPYNNSYANRIFFPFLFSRTWYLSWRSHIYDYIPPYLFFPPETVIIAVHQFIFIIEYNIETVSLFYFLSKRFAPNSIVLNRIASHRIASNGNNLSHNIVSNRIVRYRIVSYWIE